MKANELRVGNWVRFGISKPCQFELGDFADWYNDHNSHEYGDHISPIEITEEWLLKFGFEQWNSWGLIRKPYVMSNVIDGTSDFMVVLGEDPPFVAIDGNCVCWSKTLYVHQLQNLYQSLTGEEL